MSIPPTDSKNWNGPSFDEFNMGHIGIGGAHPCFLIAEVGQAHDGSLGIAHSYIDFVADSGFDAIKFQTHIAAQESTLDEPFRAQFSWKAETRYDYWKRMEFQPDQWVGLKQHATDKGLVFLSTPFSVAAADLLEELGIVGWKIGSGDLCSKDILERVAKTKKPIICSTGLSGWQEIDEVVRFLGTTGSPFALMHTTSRYPTSLDEVAIGLMAEIDQRYNVPTGLSDHTGKIWPSIYALALGADLIEVHVTIDRNMFGPDSESSLTPSELQMIGEARDAFGVLATTKRDKDDLLPSLQQTKLIFQRSACTRKPMKKGDVLSQEDVIFKKPGGGITTEQLNEFLGKKLRRNVTPMRLLIPDDFE